MSNEVRVTANLFFRTAVQSFILLLACLVGAGASGDAQSLEQARSSSNDQAVSANVPAVEDSLFLGRMNDVSLRIPKEYAHFPPQYMGQSPWRADSGYGQVPLADKDRVFSSFSIDVLWPTLAPKSPSNERTYWLSREKFITHDWLTINVQFLSSSPAVRERWKQNGLARSLNRTLSDPGPYPRLPDGVAFVSKGKIARLSYAHPNNSISDAYKGWNQELLWKGDRETAVSVLIQCGRGKLPLPEQQHSCEHKFEYSQLNAMVSMTYQRRLLEDWEAIQDRVSRLLASFISTE